MPLTRNCRAHPVVQDHSRLGPPDKKPRESGPVSSKQADCHACQTMEMSEAFEFSDRMLKEACWIDEVTFWKPDANQPDHIVRHGGNPLQVRCAVGQRHTCR